MYYLMGLQNPELWEGFKLPVERDRTSKYRRFLPKRAIFSTSKLFGVVL